jgi:glutathione S-transferase
MATALAFVRPREAARLGPATRTALIEPEIAPRYEDLLAWRDRIYARHRVSRRPTKA